MEYRKDLDGLRALAIIPVILFHLEFPFFKGGYLGVDVFFVLSGFLITSLLKEEIFSNRFSLIDFYERRARRLYPALIFMLSISSLASYVILPPYEFLKFFASLSWVTLFNSNLFFWLDVDYFKSDSILNPLLHTWTLAVEEQYYIIFPLLFLFLFKRLNLYLNRIIVSLVLLSFVTYVYGSFYHISANFYLLPFRFWEIGVGSILALNFSEIRKKINFRYHSYVSFLGLFILCFSYFYQDTNVGKYFFVLLFPILGTSLLVLFSQSGQFTFNFLSNRILVFVGKLSYSLYLFHQPVIAFSKFLFRDSNVINSLIVIVLILIFSLVSYHIIESNFRNRSRYHNNSIWRITIISCLILVSFSFYIYKIDRFQYERYFASLLITQPAIVASNVNDRKLVVERIHIEQTKYQTLVLGSSRLMQFSSDKRYPNLLNLSVSGATLEDYLAIGVLAVNKFQPKVIYVGVEPWLFNSKNDDDRWREIQSQYHESVALMNGRLGTITHRADNYSYLFSLYKSVNVSLSSISVNDEISDQDKIRKDGSRLYSIARSNLSPIEVNRTIQEYGFYNMDNFEFDSTRYVKFIRFVKYIQQRDVKVIFVLSPYHPDLYYLIQKQKKEILFMEGLFKRLATSLNIQTKGSYNPEYCNCEAKSFYDAIHPKAECIKEKVILCE